jgi:pimeloyl-ACP methyl ester carboxylesterase
LDCAAPGLSSGHIPQGLPDLPDKLGCEARAPGYIDAITTEATARDIDAVRQALGERRIDFLGISAGTNLGSVYATLFPEHVDKLVLDSAVDPDWVWDEQFAQATGAWQARMDDLFDWIAGHDSVYHLGATRAQVYLVWASQVAAQGGGFLASLGPQTSGLDGQRWRTANLLRSVEHPGVSEGPTFVATFTALYSRQFWPYLAQGLQATRGNPRDTRLLHALALHAPVDATPGAWVFEAVSCNETRPPDPAALGTAVGDLATGASSLDFISNLRRGGLSCLGWPPVTAAVYPTGARLATRPLMLQSDHDPATPVAGACRLADVMDARVIRVGGGDHGHFAAGDPTLDAAVVRYLETGTVQLTSAAQVPIRTPLLPGPFH